MIKLSILLSAIAITSVVSAWIVKEKSLLSSAVAGIEKKDHPGCNVSIESVNATKFSHEALDSLFISSSFNLASQNFDLAIKYLNLGYPLLSDSCERVANRYGELIDSIRLVKKHRLGENKKLTICKSVATIKSQNSTRKDSMTVVFDENLAVIWRD